MRKLPLRLPLRFHSRAARLTVWVAARGRLRYVAAACEQTPQLQWLSANIGRRARSGRRRCRWGGIGSGAGHGSCCPGRAGGPGVPRLPGLGRPLGQAAGTALGAEAIARSGQGHWLVAQIQGRPRLEKPPLPRWTIAPLMAVTGREDELGGAPSARLSALGMVGAGRTAGLQLGDRSVGVASGLVLTSLGFFISRAAAGRQRRPAGLLHHPGPLRRLAPSARRGRRAPRAARSGPAHAAGPS